DLCARVGGDGFIIIRSDLQSKEDAITIAQDIIHAFDQPFSLQEREIYLSISMGIAVAPEDGTDADTLFKNADSVMYSLKKAGQNTYRLYDQEVHLESLQKIEMERELRKALEREELELYYQPQVDLKGDYITGAEALIRWNHPTKGQIPPGKFISLAEQTGLIILIGEWVIEEACRQMKEWKEKKLGIQYLAINLSGRQFQDRNLIDNINEKIEKYGLNPSDLELEITETIAMENLEYAIATLESLENMGFNISLDDFGTGYSSMNYLKHLPISTVKIDRSFLEDIMEGDEGERAIIEAVIALAHANQLKVVAEGIETNEQLEFLRAQNCDKGQGYLFSRPLSVSALEKLLQKRAKLYE
ncbi:MAG: bifunctional diguanylate cyclase/phosphodiesterase, partial [Epulopiscium sp.]|nr:bifunctional diguanylate cyclase/phosphodiesterase [Candidatus Epulonipiscium sp.]